MKRCVEWLTDNLMTTCSVKSGVRAVKRPLIFGLVGSSSSSSYYIEQVPRPPPQPFVCQGKIYSALINYSRFYLCFWSSLNHHLGVLTHIDDWLMYYVGGRTLICLWLIWASKLGAPCALLLYSCFAVSSANNADTDTDSDVGQLECSLLWMKRRKTNKSKCYRWYQQRSNYMLETIAHANVSQPS